MQPEKILQNKIIGAIGSLPDIRAFPNDVGTGYHGKPVKINDERFIRHPSQFMYGLATGASDIIGYKRIIITPEMVGQSVAVFMALEVKTPSGSASPEQKSFIATVQRFGGIGAFVRSVEEAMGRIVKGID